MSLYTIENVATKSFTPHDLSLRFPYNLGQADPPADPEPPPIISPDPAPSIAELYERLVTWCNENIDPNICDKFLPDEPIWLPAPAREGFGLPWWAWGGIGFLAARIL